MSPLGRMGQGLEQREEGASRPGGRQGEWGKAWSKEKRARAVHEPARANGARLGAKRRGREPLSFYT